jgi:hypothetical protein
MEGEGVDPALLENARAATADAAAVAVDPPRGRSDNKDVVSSSGSSASFAQKAVAAARLRDSQQAAAVTASMVGIRGAHSPRHQTRLQVQDHNTTAVTTAPQRRLPLSWKLDHVPWQAQPLGGGCGECVRVLW